DEVRAWQPQWQGQSSYILAGNRNKRDLTLNLKDPRAVAICLRLAEQSDVLVESFRTGTADKLGVGYAAVRALNPRLVYCSISGRPPGRLGNAHPAMAPYQTFATADGYLILGVANDGLWRRFCRAVDRPDLVDDARFATNPARVARRAELADLLQEMFATRPT